MPLVRPGFPCYTSSEGADFRLYQKRGFAIVLSEDETVSCSICFLADPGDSRTGFAAPAAGPDQVPNPYVSYATYQDAARVLGFCPLTLSRDSGYALDGISVISGRSSDLSFVRLGQPETKVRIRTALKTICLKKLSVEFME